LIYDVTHGLFILNFGGVNYTAVAYAQAASSSSSGLSGGTVAGIVIGVLVGVIILMLVVMILLRNKTRDRRASYEVNEAANSGDIVTEVETTPGGVASDLTWDNDHKSVVLVEYQVNPNKKTYGPGPRDTNV